MPPFRAEHIGSLLRPKALLEARYGPQPLDPEELRALEDAHVAAVVRWQEGLGLESITDGEFRRISWRLGFVQKVSGFARMEAIGEVDVQHDDAGNKAKIGDAHCGRRAAATSSSTKSRRRCFATKGSGRQCAPGATIRSACSSATLA